MAYPNNTNEIWQYMTGVSDPNPVEDFDAPVGPGNVVSYTYWNESKHGTKPTEQETIDVGNSAEYNRSIKNAELEAQRTTYTANQLASDSKLTEVVQMENDWVDGQAVELLKLTDVQDIQDFDTSKPDVLTLPNNVLGKRYYDQGLRMQTENDSAVSAGQNEQWDATALSGFIATNQVASADITAATAPLNPDYKLRQGTVTPADRSSQILIYRGTRQYAGRPSPDPSLEMVITNKSNGRDLYAFLYLQTGTYLEWVQFIDKGNNRWEANSSVNVISWIASDLDIIMSYGTNPAVQQDYFTNPIPFDAGGEQIVLRVRWDSGDIVTQGRSTGRGRNR